MGALQDSTTVCRAMCQHGPGPDSSLVLDLNLTHTAMVCGDSRDMESEVDERCHAWGGARPSRWRSVRIGKPQGVARLSWGLGPGAAAHI